jgi:hypothetical protein
VLPTLPCSLQQLRLLLMLALALLLPMAAQQNGMADAAS